MPQVIKFMISRYLFLWLIVFSFSACTRKPNAINSEIDQQEAIDIATEIALMSIPEFSGSQVPPFNIIAEKMTLEEASRRLNANQKNAFSDNSPDTDVWLVSMDGIWHGAVAPGLPTPEPFRHISIILHAKTGLEIFRNAQP